MATPTDEALYNKTKNDVDKIYDKPSAYRSMAYTRFYLRAYRDKYGDDKKAYKGKRPGDLHKWRKEQWVDVRSYVKHPDDPEKCGNVEYDKGEYPYCMPLSEAKKYTKTELIALIKRKDELGKTRLVRDPYLRDLGMEKGKKAPREKKEVVKMTKEDLIKEHKQLVKDLKNPTKENIDNELKRQSKELVEYEKKPRGRPRVEKPAREPMKRGRKAKPAVEQVVEETTEAKKETRGRKRLSDEQRSAVYQAKLEARKTARATARAEKQAEADRLREARIVEGQQRWAEHQERNRATPSERTPGNTIIPNGDYIGGRYRRNGGSERQKKMNIVPGQMTLSFD